MNALQKKLRIKVEQKILVLNAPNGYVEHLGEGLSEMDLAVDASKSYDFVQLFVKSIEELHSFVPDVLKVIHSDSLLWICYPKKSAKIKTDINRDAGWDILNEAGWRQVSLVSIDETWSSLRFRPYEKVQNKK